MVAHYADLAACLVAVLLSSWAYVAIDGGNPLRLALVAPMLLFVPGYLLIEAFRSSGEPLGRRVTVAAVAPGLSIAFVAILALATAALPGGFLPNAIVAMVSLVSLGLLASACYRRTLILWLAGTTPRSDPNQLPGRRRRGFSRAQITPADATARPPGLPPVAAQRPLQPVRPGSPVKVPARQAPAGENPSRPQTAPNSGADLRDQGKPPARTNPRLVQTGR